MTWKKILFLLILAALGFYLWHNGIVRTALRALMGGSYPSEIKKIESSFLGGNIIKFDLSEKPPSLLALGIYYPNNTKLKEIGDDLTLFDTDKPIEVKIFKGDRLIKSTEIRTIRKRYPNFRKTNNEVAAFHYFIWTPKIKIPGINDDEEDNSRVEINLNGQFEGFKLIIFDYLIK